LREKGILSFILFDWKLTETGKKILKYLLDKKESNSYSISNDLGRAQSSIDASLERLLKRKLIKESSTRLGKRKPKQEVKLYTLTPKGLVTLIHPWYTKVGLEDEERIEALTWIFSKIKDNYPRALPKIYMDLPPKFAVALYPSYGSECVKLSALHELVRARAEGSTRFYIENDFFKVPVRVTEEVINVIRNHLEE